MRKLLWSWQMLTAGLAAVLATGLMAGQCTPESTDAQIAKIQELAVSLGLGHSP